MFSTGKQINSKNWVVSHIVYHFLYFQDGKVKLGEFLKGIFFLLNDKNVINVHSNIAIVSGLIDNC